MSGLERHLTEGSASSRSRGTNAMEDLSRAWGAAKPGDSVLLPQFNMSPKPVLKLGVQWPSTGK